MTTLRPLDHGVADLQSPRGQEISQARRRIIEACGRSDSLSRAEAVTRRVINAALAGDMAAMKLVMDRVCPPRKSRPIQIDLPEVADARGVALAQAVVVAAVSGGEISPDEATALSGLLEARRRALETLELEARIQCLERNAK